MQSSIPLFKKALVARLKADTTILADAAANSSDVLVSWGNPHPKQEPRVLIVIDDTKNREPLEYVAADTQANERYEVGCLLSVTGDVENKRDDLWTRAYALFDAIDASLMAWDAEGHANTGGVARARIGAAHDQDAVESRTREAAIAFDISVLARIS